MSTWTSTEGAVVFPFVTELGNIAGRQDEDGTVDMAMVFWSRKISSGDSSGNVVFWDWKTGRIKSRLPCHQKVVIAHEWLPHETVSTFVTQTCTSF